MKAYLAKLASDFEKVDELPTETWELGVSKITGRLMPGARVAWCFDEDVGLWRRDRLPYPHPKDWPYQGFIMPFPETCGRREMEAENVCLVVTDYPIEKENPVTDWCVLAFLFDTPGLHRIYIFSDVTTAHKEKQP